MCFGKRHCIIPHFLVKSINAFKVCQFLVRRGRHNNNAVRLIWRVNWTRLRECIVREIEFGQTEVGNEENEPEKWMRAKVMVMTDLRITSVVVALGKELRTWNCEEKWLVGWASWLELGRCAKSDQFPPPQKFLGSWADVSSLPWAPGVPTFAYPRKWIAIVVKTQDILGDMFVYLQDNVLYCIVVVLLAKLYVKLPGPL
jgi:hypothetical protein